MKYNVENYRDGISFINIDNGLNLKTTLCTYGASVFDIKLNDKLITLTFKDKEDFLSCPAFYGKTLGRVCGRIAVNGDIDGETYHLDPTDKFNYSLHAGHTKSISFKNFKYQIKEYKNKLDVIFSIHDKKGANGFLGDADIKVIYEIYSNNNNFKMIFKGKTSTKTYMNLSNHIYFNFFYSKDISDYSLKVNANQVSIMDKDLFIIGKKDVNPELDFRKMCKLGPKLTFAEKKTSVGTIDHTFLFENIETKTPQVILKNNELKLSLYTDYPTLNIYVDNSMVERRFVNGDDLWMRRGIALEPQLFDYDLNSLILRKGEKYNHFILFKFKF